MIVKKQFSNIPEIGKNELEVIFQDIIPPQLRDTSPVLHDLFFLFLRYIEPTTRISFDINLKNNEDFNTIDLQAFKRNIVNMFLNTFSVAFYKGLDDTEIINDLKKFLSAVGQDFIDINRDYPFNDGFNFTEDLILFSQKAVTDKGKANPYYFYSKLLSKTKLVFDDDANFYINVEEGDEPYKYKVEGSLRRAIFNKIVKPLAHPVGFSLEYINRVYNNLEDFFDIEELQSNFVVKIKRETNVLDFSSGIIHISWTKDIFGRDIYFIQYSDGSYIKKDGSGKIVFYSKDNTVLTVIEKAELLVSFDRKFVTRVRDTLLESSNRYLKTSYWKNSCYRLGVDRKRLGENGLKLCSFQKLNVDNIITKSSSKFNETSTVSEELQINRSHKFIDKYKISETVTTSETNSRLSEILGKKRYYLGEGIKLNDPKTPVVVLSYENIVYPTSAIDFEIIKQNK
jgi:hypothetical protein